MSPQALPKKVWVGLPDNKGYWQDITLEGNLSYCSHCRIHGHELASCRKKKPAEPVEKENQRSKQHTQKTEWKLVTSKGNKGIHSGTYGPDLLYAVTTSAQDGENIDNDMALGLPTQEKDIVGPNLAPDQETNKALPIESPNDTVHKESEQNGNTPDIPSTESAAIQRITDTFVTFIDRISKQEEKLKESFKLVSCRITQPGIMRRRNPLRT